MALTQQQLSVLLKPIEPRRVGKVQGRSHLEAWDVRRYLTRIFGFGGWDFRVLGTERIERIEIPPAKPGDKTRYTVVYQVTARLTIKDPEGNVIGSWDDGATGDSPNQLSIGDANDMALKTAMSQALKRCAMNLGDQFGLSLYNNGSTDPVVIRTLAPESEAQVDVEKVVEAEKVEPGEDSPLAEPEPIVERRSAPLVREPVVVKPPKPSGVKPEASEAAVNLSRSAQQCRSREGAVSVRQMIWAAHTRGEVTDSEFEKLSGYINTIIDKYQEVNA